jgi:transposase
VNLTRFDGHQHNPDYASGRRCQMSDRKGMRRGFSPEFKVEAVRRLEERRAQGVSVTQIARELDVRPDMLRVWKRQLGDRAGAPLTDVFPGQGRLPSDQEELRRLQREVTRLQQENAFLKSAAAYFARESR